jgi:hypothetical protein
MRDRDQEGTGEVPPVTKPARQKRPYRTPRLTSYGDFHKLTLAKGGTLGDTGVKPNTRLGFPPG